MSQEYEELARRVYAALNRQDLAAFLRLIDPDVEFVSGAGHFEGGAYHGHSGVRDWWADLHGVYSDWTVEALSFRHLGTTVLSRKREAEDTVREAGHLSK